MPRRRPGARPGSAVPSAEPGRNSVGRVPCSLLSPPSAKGFRLKRLGRIRPPRTHQPPVSLSQGSCWPALGTRARLDLSTSSRSSTRSLRAAGDLAVREVRRTRTERRRPRIATGRERNDRRCGRGAILVSVRMAASEPEAGDERRSPGGQALSRPFQRCGLSAFHEQPSRGRSWVRAGRSLH